MKLRDNKGFSEIDIGIALVILLIMFSLVASLFYNFGTSTKGLERENRATHIAIQTIELLKIADYRQIEDGMTIEQLMQAVDLEDDYKIEVQNGYKVEINVQKHNEIEGNEELEDFIKIVTVKVKYNVNNIEQKIELTTSIVDNNKI